MIHTPSARRMLAAASAALALGVLPFTMPSHADHAAAVPALLQLAEHDTNTVTSLSHHDTQKVVQPNLTISLALKGVEDETHNRESDSESATYVGKTGTGQKKTVHYTLDIIFLNGKTYYRSSLLKNKWLSHTGMTLADPYSHVGWKRARTTVPVLSQMDTAVTYSPAGTSGGLTRFHGAFSTKTVTGTDDLWVSSGSHPYVVREEQRYTLTVNKQKESVTEIDHFGGFNTPVVITTPSKQGGV